MIGYKRINISERIDVDKTNQSKECMLCHYWYFLHKSFSYGPYISDDCYNFSQNSNLHMYLHFSQYIQNLFFMYD